MEKKTWNEEDGGRWDYSNKQKQKILAEQKKVETKKMKKKKCKAENYGSRSGYYDNR